ncbi:MAG: aminodeoxychorismate synthase component I [Pseudomonadota bacterium]
MTKILIDTGNSQLEHSYYFENPTGFIVAENFEQVGKALSDLEHTIAQGKSAAGFFSYELGYALEKKLNHLLPKESNNAPLIWFAIFDHFEPLNSNATDDWLSSNAKAFGKEGYTIENMSLSHDELSYQECFQNAQNAISSGDIYQLNLTFKSSFTFSGNPTTLYQDLKRKQNMGHGALIMGEDFTILSASPELFLDLQQGCATTRPMKGTKDRGLTYKDDQHNKTWLAQDQKSQAENLMIVDLMRNDLARISEIGSVHVPELFAVETYPTLHQMTSTVCANLKPDIDLKSWLKALFPPGSITGAPKIRAMELIHDLEHTPRGIYTGTIGMFLPKQKSTTQVYFNVAIRTLTLWPDGTGEMGIGSGVVSDSKPKQEYQECLLKMQFLTKSWPSFELLETLMCLPQTGYLYYDHHLQRLKHSAAYFDFKYDQGTIKRELEELAKTLKTTHRVRLLLSQKGRITLTSTPAPAPNPNKIMRYMMSDKTMHTDNLFLYHKTTNRAFYDDEHKAMAERYNCDEVIFLNQHGHLTEGSRTNLFIKREGDPTLLTPPISCGLLAGTLRADLIEKGKVKEQCLTRKDLKTAEQIFLGNSVRGLCPAIAIDIETLAV